MVIRVSRVPVNSPKHRVRKGSDGLWHAYRSGWWVASYSSWERALRAAAEGRL
jgi:hypothetical protein